MEIPFNSPEMLGVSVSPPTWNIIGSSLLLSSSHWPRRCQSSNLTCEASLQLYTRAGGTSGLVVASYREQGKKRECYLSAYIVAEVTAGVIHSTPWMKKPHSSVSSWQGESIVCA
ncbi:hypothetical protein F7725_014538 [Dissostichus mawsoni]|uniref:Uncharacterized protein n=1 Tax=Dissostichus mawsoni TaxID=36200 RepID=A0A7J5YWK7_DISMA|nr:hypothetical protein F7725_014538 [Dissostichus mawsoni]